MNTSEEQFSVSITQSKWRWRVNFEMNVSRNDHKGDFHRGKKTLFAVQMKLVQPQPAEITCLAVYRTSSNKSRKL